MRMKASSQSSALQSNDESERPRDTCAHAEWWHPACAVNAGGAHVCLYVLMCACLCAWLHFMQHAIRKDTIQSVSTRSVSTRNPFQRHATCMETCIEHRRNIWPWKITSLLQRSGPVAERTRTSANRVTAFFSVISRSWKTVLHGFTRVGELSAGNGQAPTIFDTSAELLVFHQTCLFSLCCSVPGTEQHWYE